MTGRPRVFIVNESLLLNPDTGERERKFDFSSALEHGDLVHATPAGRPPSDHRVSLELLRKSLADFEARDFLLLVGHPVLIGLAVALAADKLSDGEELQLLDWVGRAKRYAVTRVNVFGLDTVEG